jgi:hypothetical protein
LKTTRRVLAWRQPHEAWRHGIQLQPWLNDHHGPRSVEAQLERHRARLTDLIDDRRFAETIYRVALADGIMDCVTYQDPPEGAS